MRGFRFGGYSRSDCQVSPSAPTWGALSCRRFSGLFEVSLDVLTPKPTPRPDPHERDREAIDGLAVDGEQSGQSLDGEKRLRSRRRDSIRCLSVGHDSTLRDGESPQGNRDQSCRDARERLARFAVEFFVDEHPDFRALGIGPIDDEVLEQAAEEVLAAHQWELLRLESPVERATARELARDRYQAINALIQLHGDKRAKEKLLSLTEGSPLTICMGDRYRIGGNRIQRPVQTMLGEVKFTVDGCRAVFSDVTRTDGGKMWPGLCPDCRNPHSKPTRTQSRALRRRLNRMWEGHGARVYRYSANLPLDDPREGETR